MSESENSPKCPTCKRGQEACAFCEDISVEDWEAICDCGLWDFGCHLLTCVDRGEYRYVVSGTYEQAKELLSEAPREVEK